MLKFPAKALVAAVLTLSSTLVAAKDNPSTPGGDKKVAGTSVSVVAKATKPAPKVKAAAAFSRAPLAFEANQGQVDPRVQYLSRGAGYNLFLTRDEAVLSLANKNGQPDVLRVKLTGADAKSKVTALERLGWNNNYFIGSNPKNWRTNVPNYRKVQFDNVYPGVSLVYYGNQQQLEHDFVVAPGADPKQIAMEIAGAKDLLIDENGNLVIQTARGEVRFEKPILYQDVNGTRKEVVGKFTLRDKKNVGFEIAAYDRSKALVIDPVINFGTLLSTSVLTSATGVAVDGSGNAYVTGITQATTFPAPAPAPGTTAAPGPSDDIYVVQVSSDGSSLGYVSFIGSSGNDAHPVSPTSSIALDASNNAYITGFAACTGVPAAGQTDFPTTTDAFQQSTNCPGTSAAFVTVLNPAGNGLLYSTLYGGDGNTNSNSDQAIAVVGQQAFITGLTTSSGVTLPTSANAFQGALQGSQDAFLAQIDTTSLPNTNGGTCDGVGNDTIDFGVAHAFVVGEQVTISGVTPSAATTFNQVHAVVTAIGATTITYADATCTLNTDTGAGGTTTGGLVYGTHLGGTAGGTVTSGGNAVFAVALNQVYVGGATDTTNFPTLGPAQAANAGGFDGFITEFDPTQANPVNTVVASTYEGGSLDDGIAALTVDGGGTVYVAGATLSTDFPNTAGGAQAVNGGAHDAFISSLPGNLAIINQSSYLGGTGDEFAYSLALDPTQLSIWVVGQTASAAGPFNTNGIQPSLSGAQDGFITSFNVNLLTVNVSTYFGGNGNADTVMSVAAVANDQIIVVGDSDSTDLYTLGATTGSAYQTVPASANRAGFAAKFAANNVALTTPNFFSTPATNSVDPLTFDAANNSDYTVTLTNNDPAQAATHVTLDLHMDLTKLAINTVTPTNMTCVTGQLTVSSGITCDAGSINGAGGTASVVVNVQAKTCAGICPATSATTNISVGASETGGNATATLTSNIKPVADVAVGAISAASNVTGANKFVVQKDSTFTYSYLVSNNGPNSTGTFDVVNNLPAGFTAVGSISVNTGTATSQTCDAQVGATITCHVDTLSTPGSVSVSISGDPTALLAANVASTTNQLDFSSNVTITGATYIDSSPGNDTSSHTGSTLERDVNLTSAITATPDVNNTPGHKFVVDQDTTISYQVDIQNAGPSNSTNTVLTVNFPANSALPVQPAACVVGPSGFVPGTGVETCVIGTLNKAAVTTPVIFVVTPPALSANSASTVLATNASLDTNPVSAVNSGTSTSSSNTTQERDINLTIPSFTAAANVTNVANGAFVVQLDSTIAYATTVLNSGPSNATNVVLTVNFPPNSTFAQPGTCGVGTTYVAGTGVETCVIGNLAKSAVATPISFTVTPPALANTTASVVLNSSASMTTSPVSGVNSGVSNPSVSNTEQRVAPLTFSVTPPALTAEQQVGPLSYQVKASNAGPSDAVNVQFQITLDSGVASNFTSLVGSDGAAGCGAPVGQVVTCQSAVTIPAASNYIVTFTATAPTTINGNAAPATQSFSTGAPVAATVQAVGGNNPANALVAVGGATQTAVTTPFSATIERRSDLSVGALTATVPVAALSGSISLDLTASSSNTNYAIPGTTVVYTLKPTGSAVSFTSGGAVNVGSTTGAACVNSTPAPAGNLVITCTVASLSNAGQPIHLVIGTPTTDDVSAGTTSTGTFTTSACISGPVTAASDPGNACGPGDNNLSTSTAPDPTSTIQRQADLDITTVPFAGAPNPVSLAGPLTYTYSIKNNGPDTALNVKSTITLASTAVSAGGDLVVISPVGCVRNSTNIDCSLASIANGATVPVTVQITPPLLTTMTGLTAFATDTLNGSVAFGAQVSTLDPIAGNNSNATNTTTTLQRTADVNIAAQAFNATSSAASNAGAVTATTVTTNLTGTMTMTFGLTNAGPDTALNSKVQLTNVSGAVGTAISGITSSGNAACSLVAGNIQCSVTSVPTGPATTVTVNFTPPTPTSMTLAGAASPTGAFTTTAALNAQTSYVDGTPGNNNNATTVTTNLQRQSNLQMAFGGAVFTAPSTVDITGILAYTYNFKNAGPDPALKLATRITQTNPSIHTASVFQTAGSTYDIGAGPVALASAATNGCVVSSSTTIDCEADGPIPVGISNGFVVNVTPPLTTNMFNGASSDSIFENPTISSVAVIDNNAGDNASPSTLTTNIQRTADLAVTVAAATSFTAGNVNAGPSFVVQRDSTIHFDYTVQNFGASDSPATVLTVSFPAGSLLPAQPAACSGGTTNYNAGTATETCDLGTLTVAAGATTISFNVTPPALNPNTGFTGLNAQATITGGVIDGTPANNAKTALITQERDVALTIPTMTATPNVNVAPPAHFVDGQDSTISYVLNLANGGPSDATNVVLTFNLPAGSLLPAQPGACGGGSNYNAGTATETCNVGTILNGANTPVTFIVTPPALAANTPTTVLSALATLNTASAVTSGNSSNAVNITQERDADLSATISAPVTTLDVGPGFDSVSNGHQQVVYTIIASNAGPSPATGVKVIDVLPTGFNFTAFTSTLGGVTCTGAGAPVVVTCDFGAATLANAATNTITITATATAASLNAALSSNIVTNNASIASVDLNDPTPGNNSTPVAASVTLHGEADISISGTTATPSLGAPLHVGDDLIYAVTVHNAGPHPTQNNLAFTNILPAGVVPVSVTAGSGSTVCVLGATTTCTMASGLPVNGNEVESIRVHVPASAVGALNNNANVHTPANPVVDGEDSNLGNNAGANATTALAAADVAVAQVAAPNPTFASNATTFTVTLTNPAPAVYTPGTPNPIIGGSNATGVTVHNVVTVVPAASVPTGVAAITNNFGAACPASVAIAGGTATFNCTGGAINSNATNTITFTLTPSVIGTMQNVASITAANEFDPVAANNTATANDATVNTPICAGAGCLNITPVDPISGNNPLTNPQSASVTFSNVTTQGSTTLAISAQPGACLVNDSTAPAQGVAGSGIAALVNNTAHVPFRGNVVNGSRTFACGSGAQPLFYDLATSAVTSGNATVCVNYSGTSFHKADRVRLLNLTGGGVQDITIAAGFSATTICGQVAGLTSASGTIRLAVMEPSNAMPNLVAAAASVDTSASGGRGASGAAIDLSAVGTFDNDGPDGCNASSVNTCSGGSSSDFLTYTWTSSAFLNAGPKIGITPAPQPTNATGTVQVLLTVSDPYGNSETKLFNVTISASGGGGGTTGSGLVTTATVNKGQAASFTTELDNPGGATSGPIVVSNAAALATNQIVCSVSPSTLQGGSVATTVTVLCSTQGQVFGKLTSPKLGPDKDEMPLLAGMMGITALPLLGMLLVPGKSRRRRMLKMWAAIGLVMLFTMFQAACGGGGASSFGGAPQLKNAGTPTGTYQVILTPLPAGVTPSLVPDPTGTTTVPAATTFTLNVQ